jgi:hypothetical protein
MRVSIDFKTHVDDCETFPALQVSLDVFEPGLELKLMIVNSDNNAVEECGSVSMAIDKLLMQIKPGSFMFQCHHRKQRFRICGEVYDQQRIVCSGYSREFQIQRRPMKKSDHLTRQTLLLDIPGIGVGYARRLSSIHLRTLEDLANTTLTSKEIYELCFSKSDQEIFETIVTEVLQQHQVENSQEIIAKIQDRFFLDFSTRVNNNHFTLTHARIHELQILAKNTCQGKQVTRKRLRC